MNDLVMSEKRDPVLRPLDIIDAEIWARHSQDKKTIFGANAKFYLGDGGKSSQWQPNQKNNQMRFSSRVLSRRALIR